ncbi:MAG: 5-methyltetrahydropteroyltriglutamate--homocysteine S-methyltransferase [Deferribacterales bacterium]
MLTHIPGFPRIGTKRELKHTLESYWNGKTTLGELKKTAEKLKLFSFETQKKAGLSFVAAGDFSLYDRMLDTALMLGMVPDRFINKKLLLTDTYFSMARGDSLLNLKPLPMKKWFNTNYHYIVPELTEPRPEYMSENITADVTLANKNGYEPMAVIIGPVTFLALSSYSGNRWELTNTITDIYLSLLKRLSGKCSWVSIEEPILCMDMDRNAQKSFADAHRYLRKKADGLNLMLTTYFGDPYKNLKLAADTEYDALHLDMTSIKRDITDYTGKLPQNMSLSAGVVNGRNIWKADTAKAAQTIKKLTDHLGTDRVMVSSGCSLLHSPIDKTLETNLDNNIYERMSFAVQKCGEIRQIADIAEGKAEPEPYTEAERPAGILHGDLPEEMFSRKSPYSVRKQIQQKRLNLPPLPTTTIGSFPQTAHIRSLRRELKEGVITQEYYESMMMRQISENIKKQEELGLDVLVHGEPERNDMVEYFAETLNGMCVTEHGWVQSYGSRCVKPPVIHGDISADEPFTLKWIKFAASLTKKPVKAILTGPATITQWSFVRDDISREEIFTQIAMTLRSEIAELENAGIPIIQIDEAAFAEGIPLDKDEREKYLDMAVNSFRLASSGVGDETQIHTHMCYSEFSGLMPYIAAMDADVISIEASRGGMSLLDVFEKTRYTNGIGPGVYDIHSTRIPSVAEITYLIKQMMKYISADNLWINPDCGLKTRGWAETVSSLENMTAAAALARENLKKKKATTSV